MEKTVEQLEELLKKGSVKFKYVKVHTGEKREAYGTKNLDIVKEKFGDDYLPKGNCNEVNDEVVRYFDINSEGWRSFRKECFLDYTEE
jgi:hypothetical protein